MAKLSFGLTRDINSGPSCGPESYPPTCMKLNNDYVSLLPLLKIRLHPKFCNIQDMVMGDDESEHMNERNGNRPNFTLILTKYIILQMSASFRSSRVGIALVKVTSFVPFTKE